MFRNLSVTEPHPTVPKTGGYIGGGRGGAGNYKHYTSSELTTGPSATGPASRISLSKPHRRTVPAGRGGAGNMFHESEEAIFQFDEEMLKKREARAAPVYHIGRGGAANWVDESKASAPASAATKPQRDRRTGSTCSADSQASTHSTDSIAQRILGVVSRRQS